MAEQTTRELIITIPQYLQQVRVSKGRRKKYFKKTDKIPKKYEGPHFTFKKKGKFEYLFDTETKEFPIKNSQTHGKEKYQKISGNEIYAKMNEHIRMMIVEGIKENFKKHFPDKIPFPPPYQIDMHLYTTPKYGNWDLDNLWIYTKCFQDAMVDHGLLPEDNIGYITKPSSPEYYPIVRDEDRKMVFIIREDTRETIQNHVLYSLRDAATIYPIDRKMVLYDSYRYFVVKRGKLGKMGDIVIDVDNSTMYINFGKIKVSYPALNNCLGKVYSHCIQLNCFPVFEKEFYETYKENIVKQINGRRMDCMYIK